ncbi:MAG: flavin reductase family protein [Acidobacteriota bacterium]
MINKSVTDLEPFYYFYPKNTCAVGSSFEGKTNFMAVAWSTAISYRPPIYGVSISDKRFTYHLIKRSGEFSVNFLPCEKLDLMHTFGRTSGKDTDKVAKLNIRLKESLKTCAPILEDAYAGFECLLLDARDYGDHTFFIGKVVAIHYDETIFDGEGIIRIEEIDPILYLGNNQYATSKRDSRIIKPQEVKL